jgi:mannose-6-phosphate isomerase-like protein (cupin superfamily)
MSDYSIVNIREHENIAPQFGMPDEMEARFPKRALSCEIGAVGLETLGPNFRTPFGHRHKEQEELYVVVSGSGRVKLDDEIVELSQWDAIRVAPSVARSFEGGPEGLELIAIGNDRPEGGDGEMIPDHWGD